MSGLQHSAFGIQEMMRGDRWEGCPPNAQLITQLSLTAFRNYTETRLEIEGIPVVLTGPNGSGKTNVLEALSLLVPGRGLRRAPLIEVQNRYAAEPWAVAVELTTPDGLFCIGTGRDRVVPDATRRVVHVDGKAVKSQQILADRVTMAWVTPDMDRLLADGPSPRRKLLDRLVYSFDHAHAGRVHRYEKALRERMSLLHEGPVDSAWLEALEDTLAQTGVAIAAGRLQLLRQLQGAIEETAGVFPQADITLCGFVEEALCEWPALIVEERLRNALAGTRVEDARNGTSSIGPHRSDLVVIHRARQCPADLCSTGEQKALVIAIMLAYVRVLMKARQTAPLFLLDDITAHLDERRRLALFDEILSLGVQAWLTGTDDRAFCALKGKAQLYGVDNANLTRKF